MIKSIAGKNLPSDIGEVEWKKWDELTELQKGLTYQVPTTRDKQDCVWFFKRGYFSWNSIKDTPVHNLLVVYIIPGGDKIINKKWVGF